MTTQGYVIVAVNNEGTDYVACANALCDSIHRVMPTALVSLITNQDIVDDRYDHVIKIKDLDLTEWKLSNDWQVYSLSPYDRTIKLEADMYIPRNIDYWWDILKDRDLNVCTTIRTFKGDISEESFYRKTIRDSKLPDTYNAITYFRKGEVAEQFFAYVKDIFNNWDSYRPFLAYSSEERATTDVVYAIASTAIGPEKCTMPAFTEFSMAHMKRFINGLATECWHDELIYEISPELIKIGCYAQMYPIHYYNKDFAAILQKELSNG